MHGAIPLPQYVFIVWCLSKYRNKFTFSFTHNGGVFQMLMYRSFCWPASHWLCKKGSIGTRSRRETSLNQSHKVAADTLTCTPLSHQRIDPRAGLDAMEKRKILNTPPPGNRTSEPDRPARSQSLCRPTTTADLPGVCKRNYVTSVMLLKYMDSKLWPF
jgi:hypothetical protein